MRQLTVFASSMGFLRAVAVDFCRNIRERSTMKYKKASAPVFVPQGSL